MHTHTTKNNLKTLKLLPTLSHTLLFIRIKNLRKICEFPEICVGSDYPALGNLKVTDSPAH